MALTIDRTAYNLLVDDDGSNLVGTVWTKNQVKTVLLDPIDAVLATLADPVGVAHGGTGIASYAIGDLLYASGATTLSKRAAVAVGQVLVSAGVATAPVWSASPTLTSVSLGTNPAAADVVRIPNNQWITGRNNANSGDVRMISVTTGDRVVIGDTASNVTIFASSIITTQGRFEPNDDNSRDFGATANRYRTGYFGTSLITQGFYEGTEMTAPAAGAVNTGRLYFEDNGSGKTRLMCLFNTGAAQQVAIQP